MLTALKLTMLLYLIRPSTCACTADANCTEFGQYCTPGATRECRCKFQYDGLVSPCKPCNETKQCGMHAVCKPGNPRLCHCNPGYVVELSDPNDGCGECSNAIKCGDSKFGECKIYDSPRLCSCKKGYIYLNDGRCGACNVTKQDECDNNAVCGPSGKCEENSGTTSDNGGTTGSETSTNRSSDLGTTQDGDEDSGGQGSEAKEDDNTAVIVGAVVGSLVLVGCGVVGVYCWWSRRGGQGGQAAPGGSGAGEVGGADGASTMDEQPGVITPARESSVDGPMFEAGSTISGENKSLSSAGVQTKSSMQSGSQA